MIKKNLHPECYLAKIYCEEKLILEILSTKKELNVDIWSGNHPLYTGSKKIIDVKGKIEKFIKKYISDEEFNNIKKL